MNVLRGKSPLLGILLIQKEVDKRRRRRRRKNGGKDLLKVLGLRVQEGEEKRLGTESPVVHQVNEFSNQALAFKINLIIKKKQVNFPAIFFPPFFFPPFFSTHRFSQFG